MRGLCQILKMRHPYVDRAITNECVLETAARALDLEGRARIRGFSEYYMAQRKSLFGHVLRARPDDPMRQVTFFEGTGEPKFARNIRVGRPGLDWTVECYTAAKAEVLGAGLRMRGGSTQRSRPCCKRLWMGVSRRPAGRGRSG